MGLNATYTGASLTLEGVNTITGSAKSPVLLEPSLASALRSVDRFSGNTEDFAVLETGSVTGSHRWQALDVPYRVSGQSAEISFDADSDVIIDPGVEIVFERFTGIESRGAFSIAGTMDAPVILRGAEATAGFWKGLYFEDPDDSSAVFFVDHAEIRDAAGQAFNSNGDLGAIIPWSDTSVSVTNTLFANVGSACAINDRYFDEVTDTYTTSGSSTDGTAQLVCDPMNP